MKRILWSIGTLLMNLVPILTFAAPPTEVAPVLNKSTAPAEIDYQTVIDANRLLMFVTNVGSFAFDNGAMYGKAEGLYYPRGSNLTAIYAGGLWLGARVGGDIRVSLGQYSHTYVPGPMEGATFLPDDPSFKVYKIFKEYRDNGFYDGSRPTIDPELAEIWDDYHNWPSWHGAPVDGPGDPEFIGDQTLWCVYNDADPNVRYNNAGSTIGLGVEVQQTVFAFDTPGPLGNCIFIRFLLINKGGNQLDDMYVSLWADPDIGDADDDLAGCDTMLSLGFTYNGEEQDELYGFAPPAAGYRLIQGPIVPSAGDSASFMGEWRQGYRNLPMTAFTKSGSYTDPNNAQETFWYMQGLNAKAGGVPILDPKTGGETRFMLAGDPVAGIGWVATDSTLYWLADVDILEIAGPGGVPVDPPDNVLWSWNSTGDWFIDVRNGLPNLDWRRHIGDDSWEFRFTSGGSEYYNWNTEEKFISRVPFEVWNMATGISGDLADKRIQICILDDDFSGDWSPGDRIYPLERDYYEPLPNTVQYTWDDDFRIGRIILDGGVPQEGTVVRFDIRNSEDYDSTAGSDCRFMLSSGPFAMAPDDSQEVIMAVVVGQEPGQLNLNTDLGRISGSLIDIQQVPRDVKSVPQSDRLASISELKKVAVSAGAAWDAGLDFCDCHGIGDCNDDGIITVMDIVYLARYVIAAGGPPPADEACPVVNRGDFDCSGQVGLVDVVGLINYVFRSVAAEPCDPCGL